MEASTNQIIDISPDVIAVKPIEESIVVDKPLANPLFGTNEYWVSLTSGGAVTTKLTFLDGILIKVT